MIGVDWATRRRVRQKTGAGAAGTSRSVRLTQQISLLSQDLAWLGSCKRVQSSSAPSHLIIRWAKRQIGVFKMSGPSLETAPELRRSLRGP
jgi:hypothetical protein